MIRARRFFVSFTFVMVGLLSGSDHAVRHGASWSDSFENGLADSANRLSADQGSTVDVEMGHASDAVILGGALERADAVGAFVRVEEGCHRVPVEADLAGDFGQHLFGSDIASFCEITFQRCFDEGPLLALALREP